ncbi:Ribose ABC transport system, ATP-binding protein RbsA [Candidatus Rhodobacter oscarellae]|uniref:Ribose ABC transport system, ATP-binding protein RbsA n=1 Tax=Candidatus Rhodobacter oscarellae TaxID=1675527 RepID=A0A0J9EBV0_9RHOB|nr:sugar ABC transporter ATP-binding protein [Candidatus Rhodobacter lobularis]KMW60242.1 Ribose ABC transport system, ATP-binding protein RbsA [Candidatus Rhodobacter lobularis]
MPQRQHKGLFFDRIDKHFGGTYAVRDVSLAVGRGEIVALLGENGAGKSTLIKVLGGIHQPDAGQVLIDGAPYQHKPAGFGERQKVAFIHQDLGLIEWMTVAENIALALGYKRSGGLIQWGAVDDFAAQALARVECDFDPSTRVEDLTRTEKSLVAIARALAVDSEFLVLDEPTASLPADEVERLFSALRPLRDSGVGMIYVSHRLDEIFRIADRVAVLRDGTLVGVRSIEHTTPEELVQKIVGRKTRETLKSSDVPGAPILSLRNFAAGDVSPVDITLRDGEIVGLVGLRGAGHEALSRALFGVEPYAGSVDLNGEVPDLSSPQAAMRAGIGLVAKDRTEESVAMSLTIRENTFLNPAGVGRSLLNLLSLSREASQAAKIGSDLGLSPNDPSLAIEALSGGNQQKVVLGRWLATNRKLLVCEDPTAGVDVGAKAEIYALLNRALADGVGILVVSTDFEEIATLCHRAIVFSQGQIVDEITGTRLSTENLIQAASASNITHPKEDHHAIA